MSTRSPSRRRIVALVSAVLVLGACRSSSGDSGSVPVAATDPVTTSAPGVTTAPPAAVAPVTPDRLAELEAQLDEIDALLAGIEADLAGD